MTAPRFRQRYGVSVPATSANLGPGFDSFGIALDLRNDFFAELDDEWSVEIEGEGADHLRTDGANQVAVAMGALFAAEGHPDLRARIHCINRVPTGNGLGSSSTAIVGGLLLGRELLEVNGHRRLEDRELFELAVEMEGHPDNVAPALFGGFTICWMEGSTPQFAQFTPVFGLAAVVIPSSVELATSHARTLLPELISHADATYNIARAGLLAAALAGGRADLLHAAFSDRVHEPYRAEAVEDFAQVRSVLLDAGVDGAALSGAGPTIIGFVSGPDDHEALSRAEGIAIEVAAEMATVSGRRTPLALSISRSGSLPIV